MHVPTAFQPPEFELENAQATVGALYFPGTFQLDFCSLKCAFWPYARGAPVAQAFPPLPTAFQPPSNGVLAHSPITPPSVGRGQEGLDGPALPTEGLRAVGTPESAYRVVGPAPGATCVQCNAADGAVMKIRAAAAGSKTEPLHEACAGGWFASPANARRACAQCGRPGGREISFGGEASIWLHRQCEDAYIDRREREEGLH